MIWVFNLSTDPTGEFSGVKGTGLTVEVVQRAREVSRNLAAAQKLRDEAIGRGDRVIETHNFHPSIFYWNFQDMKDTMDKCYVSNISDHIKFVMRISGWRVLDARTLSIEDGKVVSSAAP